MRIPLLASFFESGKPELAKVSGVLVFGEECPVLKGAGHHAVPATNTFILFNKDDAILTLLAGAGGAYLNTGRILAVVTAHRVGSQCSAITIASLPGNQSGPGYANRQKMLDPASRYTAVAPNTFSQIHDHSPSHSFSSVI